MSTPTVKSPVEVIVATVRSIGGLYGTYKEPCSFIVSPDQDKEQEAEQLAEDLRLSEENYQGEKSEDISLTRDKELGITGT